MQTQRSGNSVVKLMAMGIVIIMLSVGIYGAWAVPTNTTRLYPDGLSIKSTGEGISMGGDTNLVRVGAGIWSLLNDNLIGVTDLNATNVHASNIYTNLAQPTDLVVTDDANVTDAFLDEVWMRNEAGAYQNRTDFLVYPHEAQSRVCWVSGGEIYVKNTATGEVIHSTSAYTTIQDAGINSIQATGGIVFLKAGTYNLGTTTLELYSHGIILMGEGEKTVLQYSGTASAIKINNGGLVVQYAKVLDLTIEATGAAIASATASAILVQRTDHTVIENVVAKEFQAGTGFMVYAENGVGSILYGSYVNIWSYNCKIGLDLTGYSGEEVNCNYFENFKSQNAAIANSIGIKINQYCTKNHFDTFDLSDAVNATVVDGQYNLFTNGRSESISGTHIWLKANSVSNKFDFYLSVGAGTQKTDDGTTNIFENLLP